ncbi:SDR family NAD(P)-dependent oxidoreductase [Mycolicibacterium brumae]|uniref:NAD(P)-dependent oxidoreductase n=2 Tax=Mycolicibacterium brumae TaxID=85968 RepID=A0A2G5PIG8_9MYCO|nr:SDR family oxidoreductase [Mycolicibacterium brumae]MCV7194496.1 SDR family oxidoreductase [Mycolicibacterium brumae]PIB77774.1 NAD(P)-dependent oxidoreductase [Mycolicibacterium brumae]
MPTAVVTGAGRGIGRAVAARLAADGAEVVAVDADAASVTEVAERIGGRAVVCDIADEDAVAALAGSIDRLDVLVNNAGIWRSATLDDSSRDDVDAVLRVNVVGTWQLTRALAGRFGPDGGAIVNLTSVLAEVGGAGRGVYPASKAAVVALTKQMAVEYAPRRIRANAVGPGLVVTEGTAGEFADPGLQQAIGSAMPLGRLGTPEDIAGAVAFLAGPDAAYVTGQALYVDGGWGVNGSAFIANAVLGYIQSL